MNALHFSLLFSVLFVGLSEAWVTPLVGNNSPIQHVRGRTAAALATRDDVSTLISAHPIADDANPVASSITTPTFDPLKGMVATSLLAITALAAFPEGASAVLEGIPSATTAASSTILTAGGSISSALFAYGHYFSVLGIVGVLMTERLTLENGPNLTDDEENRLAIADTLYGLIALLLIYTGYFRVTDPALGKGSYFYLHEPVFWLKMAMLGVVGSCSLFNTTKIIQRSVSRATAGDKPVEPMSEALCDRMKSICNAQLTGILFIPMAATFMARGIGYNESIPWQAEAAVAALLFLGLGFKYVKEALTFEDRLLEAERNTRNTVVVTTIEDSQSWS